MSDKLARDSSIRPRPHCWVAATKNGTIIACDPDINVTLTAAIQAGYGRDDFALSKTLGSGEEESEFGGVEIEIEGEED